MQSSPSRACALLARLGLIGLTLTPVAVVAQNPDRATQLQQTTLECGSYFSLAAHCIGDANPESRQLQGRLESMGKLMSQGAAMIAQGALHQSTDGLLARAQIIQNPLMNEASNDCVNLSVLISVLIVKYDAKCKALLRDMLAGGK